MLYIRSQDKKYVAPFYGVSIVNGNEIGYDGNYYFLIVMKDSNDLRKPIILYCSEDLDECKDKLELIVSKLRFDLNEIVEL